MHFLRPVAAVKLFQFLIKVEIPAAFAVSSLLLIVVELPAIIVTVITDPR